eukprot:768810-Hanusia_phi.AAC.6
MIVEKTSMLLASPRITTSPRATPLPLKRAQRARSVSPLASYLSLSPRLDIATPLPASRSSNPLQMRPSSHGYWLARRQGCTRCPTRGPARRKFPGPGVRRRGAPRRSFD